MVVNLQINADRHGVSFHSLTPVSADTVSMPQNSPCVTLTENESSRFFTFLGVNGIQSRLVDYEDPFKCDILNLIIDLRDAARAKIRHNHEPTGKPNETGRAFPRGYERSVIHEPNLSHPKSDDVSIVQSHVDLRTPNPSFNQVAVTQTSTTLTDHHTVLQPSLGRHSENPIEIKPLSPLRPNPRCSLPYTHTHIYISIMRRDNGSSSH